MKCFTASGGDRFPDDKLDTEKEKEIQTITISATTRCLPVSISKYLGEYCTTQESYEGAPVYIQNSGYVYSPLYSGRRAYLYRTQCGWYISHELGMDYGSCVVFRNATATRNDGSTMKQAHILFFVLVVKYMFLSK